MSLFLGATGRVWHREVIVLAGGGTEDSWTPGPNVKCRIAPADGGVSATDDRINDRTTHVGTLPAYTPIEEGDQLEVGSAGLYEVLAVRKRTFDEFVRRVELIESAENIDLQGSAS